jgi:homoaconitate hydratase
VQYLDIDQRLTVANMTTEWGALAGVFPVDEKTISWLNQRISHVESRGLAGVPSDPDGRGQHPRLNQQRVEKLRTELAQFQADPDAYYAKELTLDLGTVQPHVSGPNTVKDMTAIRDIRQKQIKIDKAYLVSCVNSRVDDLSEAAEIVKNKKIAAGVEFYIAAASSEVEQESKNRGDWDTLIDAGAIPLPPGCGPCIGLGVGLLEDGEVGISATNRNFKGRMGSREAAAYLGSPAVVAASALSGYIDFPGEWLELKIQGELKENPGDVERSTGVKILAGFPEKLEGEIIFCYQDNLNTDGIYPGKYTYIDDFTPQQQAEVVMENYDPEFKNMARQGDILAGGFNFGTGSSREQAATSLKYKGIALVLAGSLNETYKRNALNNGFLVIEVPELIRDLKNRFGDDQLTLRTGISVKVDFKNCLLEADGNTYKISPVGTAAQELIVVGGLEKWVKGQIEDSFG